MLAQRQTALMIILFGFLQKDRCLIIITKANDAGINGREDADTDYEKSTADNATKPGLRSDGMLYNNLKYHIL